MIRILSERFWQVGYGGKSLTCDGELSRTGDPGGLYGASFPQFECDTLSSVMGGGMMLHSKTRFGGKVCWFHGRACRTGQCAENL